MFAMRLFAILLLLPQILYADPVFVIRIQAYETLSHEDAHEGLKDDSTSIWNGTNCYSEKVYEKAIDPSLGHVVSNINVTNVYIWSHLNTFGNLVIDRSVVFRSSPSNPNVITIDAGVPSPPFLPSQGIFDGWSYWATDPEGFATSHYMRTAWSDYKLVNNNAVPYKCFLKYSLNSGDLGRGFAIFDVPAVPPYTASIQTSVPYSILKYNPSPNPLPIHPFTELDPDGPCWWYTSTYGPVSQFLRNGADDYPASPVQPLHTLPFMPTIHSVLEMLSGYWNTR